MTANDRDPDPDRVLSGQCWRRKDEGDARPAWIVVFVTEGRAAMRQKKGARLCVLSLLDLRMKWRRVPA